MSTPSVVRDLAKTEIPFIDGEKNSNDLQVLLFIMTSLIKMDTSDFTLLVVLFDSGGCYR